jgi:hypothetical protein
LGHPGPQGSQPCRRPWSCDPGIPRKKKSKTKKAEKENELWVSPRFSLKGADGERAWDAGVTGLPNSSRFLEMADIALGLKKRSAKKTESKSVHDTAKREPYNG